MRKITMVLASVFLIGILTACSNSSDNDTENTQGNANVEQNDADENNGINNEATNNESTDDNEATNDNENQNASDEDSTDSDNEMKSKHDDGVEDNDEATKMMEDLNIEEIEVGAEYSGSKEYEAEIDHKSDGSYTSEIEDDLNDEYVKGQKAFDKLYPMVKELDLDEDSSKEEVFDQILKSFDLESDYEELEVEINFHDSDTELEYEEEK